MRTISNDFREALRGIRQLNALVTYQSEETTKYITTESGNKLTTELETLLIAEKGDAIYAGEEIININPLYETELFKTICNSVSIETKSEIPVNTWLNVKIGVLVNSNYEYLDFGDFYTTESNYNADTNSYTLTAYDKMVESMIPYDLEVEYPITIKNLLLAIFRRLNWYSELPTFVNQDKVLSKDLFSNQNLTFRDVLDNISQVIVGNIGFDGKTAKIKYINHLDIENISQNEYITEEDLKDTNVTLNKKYGPLNSIIITQNDVVLNNLQDSASVETNGLTEYNFSNNLILMNDSDTFITDMFNRINGLEYYLYDFDTFGTLCFEPLDEIIVKIGEDEYKTLILNDDIKLTQGLEETIYADIPEETTPEYIAIDKTEKKINNALISIDKSNAEIVLKVDSQGRIASATLSGNADEGTLIELKANQIKLEGYTTINGNFQIDEQGNMSCTNANVSGKITSSNATITGGDLTLYGEENQPKITIINPTQTNTYVEIGSGILTGYGAGVLHSLFYYNIGSLSLYATDGANCIYSSGGAYFKNTNGTQTIVLDPYNGNVRCVSLTQTSLEESKKNIELYNNGLEEVLKTDIYSYNYLNEDDSSKKHLGFVIGKDRNYSKEITSVDKDGNEVGVDSYSMTSLCLQAIKEQQKIIENLEQRIENLERNEK